MKLFAAFIWFYLRILPSEKATFCGSDAPRIAVSHDRDTYAANRPLQRWIFRRRLLDGKLKYSDLQNYRNISLTIALSLYLKNRLHP